MAIRLLLSLMLALLIQGCNDKKQQPIQATNPQPQQDTGATEGNAEDDPFADIDDTQFEDTEEDTEDETDDLDEADVDVSSTDISSDSGSGFNIQSVLPLVTSLMSGQMPDIGTILGMFGGGGGALSGLSGSLGSLTSMLGQGATTP